MSREDDDRSGTVPSGPGPSGPGSAGPVPSGTGSSDPVTTDTAPTRVSRRKAPPAPAMRHSSGRAAPGQGDSRTATRVLLWALAAVLAVIVLGGLFLLGQQLGGGPAPVAAPAASATPTASVTPTPTPLPEPTGPQPAGVHPWDTLFGGECVDPYASPWDEEFTVVDCAAPHAAQLVYRGSFPADAATAFPGEAALSAQINLLCTAPGVIDLGAAGAFGDIQVQGSYPVTDERWAAGDHRYYCFVSRSSAEPLTTTVAGPGPAG